MPPETPLASPRHARRRLSRRARTAAFAALGTAGLGVVVLGSLGLVSDNRSAAPVGPDTVTRSSALAPTSASPTPTTVAAVVPDSLSIASIGVHTTLQMLSLNAAGALNPPTGTTQAGWYTGSAVPGQPGPAVLAGHVDTYQGPAVFYKLDDLRPGDEITVGLSNGSSVRFQVTDVHMYPKDAFPTETVYGDRPDPELRLITCGGTFDYTTRSYVDNVVVSATLMSAS